MIWMKLWIDCLKAVLRIAHSNKKYNKFSVPGG